VNDISYSTITIPTIYHPKIRSDYTKLAFIKRIKQADYQIEIKEIIPSQTIPYFK